MAGIDASPVLNSGLVNESVLTVTDVIGSAGDSAVTEHKRYDPMQSLIEQFFPQLSRLFLGALHAFENRHSDWERHWASSIRKVVVDLLRRTAPDSSMKGFSKREYVQNTRELTHASRLLFVVESMNAHRLGPLSAPDVDVGRLVGQLGRTVHHEAWEIELMWNRAQRLLDYLLNACRLL